MKIIGLLSFVMLVTYLAVMLNAHRRQVELRNLWDHCKKEASAIVLGSRMQFEGLTGARNAVTTEPGLRVARSKDITHEDFVDSLDRIEPAETPMLSLARNEVKLGAVDRTWNVGKINGPKGANGRADNDVPSTTRDPAANIRKVGNIAQAFDEAFKVGWIAGQVPRIAGVQDIEAQGKTDAYLYLKQHQEAAMCSFDQVAVYDQGTGLGAIGAGYRKLTDSANAYSAASAYAIGKPSDIHSAPTGACISGSMATYHNRALWKSISLALRTAAKRKGDWMVLAGLNLRQAVTDLTTPVTTTVTSTAASAVKAVAEEQVRIISRSEQDTTLGATVDVILTDFGRFMVADSDYIGTTTTDSSGNAIATVNSAATGRANAAFVNNLYGGLIVKKGNVFKTWGIVPYTEKLANDGSGNTHDAKCLMAWGLDNPTLAGWLNFTA